jgi:alpha-mannosidase
MNSRDGVIAVALILLIPPLGRASDAPRARETFWVIPHTHWEGAVFKTRAEYLDVGLPNILKALHLLKTQPSYRFVLDQVAYVKPFLERYPEEAGAFRKFVAEGRLQLVLGMDIMPDVNMPGGESFVRQVLYGKGYYRQRLGVDVTAAWLIDTFGHHAQMPQLLKLAGYKSFWFSRGVPRPDHPSEFLWQGIDGSQIPAFWLPHSYGLLYGSPKDLRHFADFVQNRFRMLSPNSRPGDRVGLSGADVSEPESHLVPLVDEFNKQQERPFNLRMAVPADFEAVISKRTDRPVFKGEFNPIFQGTYSSRIEFKQMMRSMDRLLTDAEKLSTIAAWIPLVGEGSPSLPSARVGESSHLPPSPLVGDGRRGGSRATYERETALALWRAWEPVLFNQTHDLASGVMTDHVYEDTVRSYEFSQRLANELIETSWQRIAADIESGGKGIPVAVINTLSWPRTDLAEVTVGFTDPDTAGITAFDSANQEIPIQVLEATRRSDGTLQQARIAFMARDVPAMGYSIYHVVPARTGSINVPDAIAGDTLENELFQLTIDPWTGGLAGLLVKNSQWQVLRGPANVIAREPDHGDLWELYRGLDGGSKVAMTRKQPVPQPGRATLSSEFKGKQATVRIGPVFQEFRVAHPLGNGDYATTVRLLAGKRRIDFSTTLVNKEKFVRYQVLFPTTIRNGKNFQSIPFGAVERPLGIEFPAQDWVDYGDEQHGVALLNQGLPGNLVTDGTMMLSLLRSHTLGAYGFGGGYEPGMSSETGLELGKERTLRYALVPHDGDWREAGVYRDGMEFNHPLVCRKMLPHAGSLPKRWGFLDVSHPNVVVSALKAGDKGATVLRIYETTGRAASGAKLTLRAKIVTANECNLMENPGRELKVAGNAIRFDLSPFEIKTFKLRVDSGDAPASD